MAGVFQVFVPFVKARRRPSSRNSAGVASADCKADMYSDWRDRLVATKSGVEASESTSDHRSPGYLEFDHLSEAIDGDSELPVA